MESESPETWAQIAAIVAGAGVAGTVSGMVTKWVPGVASDIAGAVAGGLIYYFGSRYHLLLGAFGVGIMAGSLKGTIEKMIPAPAAPTTTTQGTGSTTSAEAAASAYVAAS